MRLYDPLGHPIDHDALTNVGPDDHHDRPENIEIANTTLSVPPLPGDPKAWDISVPFDAQVVKFSLRSNRTIAEGSAKAGVHGIATRSSLEATTFSLGGETSAAISAYNAAYSKKAAALNLSHKIFSSSGSNIALTDAYLTLIDASTRVLRLVWTNYGASSYTLNCWGEVQVIG
jgi:hypothetical protein